MQLRSRYDSLAIITIAVKPSYMVQHRAANVMRYGYYLNLGGSKHCAISKLVVKL
jgi:hypothetical protein